MMQTILCLYYTYFLRFGSNKRMSLLQATNASFTVYRFHNSRWRKKKYGTNFCFCWNELIEMCGDSLQRRSVLKLSNCMEMSLLAMQEFSHFWSTVFRSLLKCKYRRMHTLYIFRFLKVIEHGVWCLNNIAYMNFIHYFIIHRTCISVPCN